MRRITSVTLRSYSSSLSHLLTSNFIKPLSTAAPTGDPSGDKGNPNSFESIDEFESRIFNSSDNSSFYRKLDRIEKARKFPGSRLTEGNSRQTLDGLDESFNSVSDGMGGKLKEAATYFEFDPNEIGSYNYVFRSDMNFHHGSTYDVKDLDLKRPGNRKPPRRQEFEVTTEEVLRKADFRMDTKDILFICGGAFVNLEKTISERRQDASIRFGAPVRANMRTGGRTDAAVTSSLLESVESGDLIAYGLIPEFVGRFPILVSLSALNEDQLVQVLMVPKNAFGKQYKKMFNMNNVKLHFTENSLRLIAKKAMAKNTGARGLRAILENILTEAMYEVPENKTGTNYITAVLVDEEAVGSVDAPGCGAKILYGDGAIGCNFHQMKLTNSKDNSRVAEGVIGV